MVKVNYQTYSLPGTNGGMQSSLGFLTIKPRKIGEW